MNVLDILNNIFIDADGNIKFDLILDVLLALGIFSIPSCILRFIWKGSKNYKKYRNYVRNTKKQIFNTLLFPWEEEKHKFGIDYRRFYIKQLNIRNIYNPIKKVKIKKGVNTIFLGKPGSGKTTYINHLYLSQLSVIKKVFHFIIGCRLYYAKAEELISISDESGNVLNDIFKDNFKSRVFLFLDAIDEIEIDNIDDLVKKIINLQKNNITIIATCRKEEHEVFLRVNNDYAKIVDQVFEIEDWKEEQVTCYIEKYKKYAKSNDFGIRINEYLSNESYSDFFRTPLEISLMFFIVDHSSHLNSISNQYELYEQFIKKWIIRDCIKNKIAYENTKYIDDIMRSFSMCAYLLSTNNKVLSSNLLTESAFDKNYCLNGLLKYNRENENKYIARFYHLNFQDFFLSYFFSDSLLEITKYTIQALSIRYNHTVTRFIKNKLHISEQNDLEKIETNLLSVMYESCSIPKNILWINYIRIPQEVKKYFNALSDEDKTVVRNEIYFFLARLPRNQNNHNPQLLQILKVAYQYEPDVRVRRTIAISATILGDENLELQYAREILYDSDSNLIDRSFTLVYYQDVSHSNPFTYIDDNVSQWTNSRKSRINRLKSNDEKSQRMRSFDLITILNFIKSRNDYITTQDEYDIIVNCQINCSIYSNEKIQLLYGVKNELLNLLKVS